MGIYRDPTGDVHETRDLQVVYMREWGNRASKNFGPCGMYEKGEYSTPENHLLRMKRSLMLDFNCEKNDSRG